MKTLISHSSALFSVKEYQDITIAFGSLLFVSSEVINNYAQALQTAPFNQQCSVSFFGKQA